MECAGPGQSWLFRSTDGKRLWDERHFSRVWERLRRRAQKEGVRPFKLHATRHTWATMASAARKSVRWIADQLGHADPALTLRIYAHAMREEDNDLSFADFGGAKRLYPAPAGEPEWDGSPNSADSLVGRVGLEPTTNGLKARCQIEQFQPVTRISGRVFPQERSGPPVQTDRVESELPTPPPVPRVQHRGAFRKAF